MSDYRVLVSDENPWQQNVKSRITAATLGGLTPSKGDRYLLTDGGNINKIGYCSNATGPVWTYLTPLEGWICWVDDENLFYKYDGINWGLLNFVKNDGSVNPTNLLLNGDFENWALGASAVPDGWTLSGSGAAVARESSIIKLGTYSAKLTRNSNDCLMYQTFYTEKGLTYWQGKKVTFGCWVYATVANRAKIAITDGVNNSEWSSFHTGNSTWQFLTVTMTLAVGAITAHAGLGVYDGDTSAYFDGAIIVEGESIFAYADKPFLSRNVVGEIVALTTKTDLVDNDSFLIEDSEVAYAKKKSRWTGIKATLKTYFDGIYKATFAYTAEDVANKENTTIDTSTTKYPTVNLLKTGIDARVKNDGTVNPTNLLSNGDFENWSAGTAVAPDGWAIVASDGGSVAREASIIKLGTYSQKLTLTGTYYYCAQYIHTIKGIAYWQGRKITIGCWVYATVANRARLCINDGVTDSFSSYHTGDSTWQFLSITKTIDSSATSIGVICTVVTGATSAYFDGAMCVEGESAFAFSEGITPIPLGTAAAVLTADKGPAGCTAVTGWIAINIGGVQRFIPYW